uniref:Uncharacterized protein n=1 Tax=Physcomitrium patens TaxID=3218 RepID=A0A2K1IRJ6_PHYPA|nr:hypothetical protein PHYPA_026011 [Physcomitrium patens]
MQTTTSHLEFLKKNTKIAKPHKIQIPKTLHPEKNAKSHQIYDSQLANEQAHRSTIGAPLIVSTAPSNACRPDSLYNPRVKSAILHLLIPEALCITLAAMAVSTSSIPACSIRISKHYNDDDDDDNNVITKLTKTLRTTSRKTQNGYRSSEYRKKV